MSFTEYAVKALRDGGYKVTNPRKQVLEAIERAEGPMSPYDIGKMTEEEGKHLDQVTIYRVINLLCSLNLVHKVFSRGGYVRCDLLEEEGCHRFLVCRGCGHLQEFAMKRCVTRRIRLPRKWASRRNTM